MARRSTLLALAGRLSLAVALASQPHLARAQAFQGSGAASFGSATINATVTNVTTVTVNSPHATINWTPGDSAGNITPYVFLPATGTATYQGGAALSGGNYTVLNRILPNGNGAMQFNGTVNSDPAGRIWFYSPTGLILGGSARFNVGSLLLTTADPAAANGPASEFMDVEGQFTLSGAPDSTSAVVIQSGAQINATTVGQSNYVVAMAPQVQNDGAISVRGSAALVAAAGATFAIDNTGLFTISVDAANAGTTVTGTDALSVTGSVGGPDAGSAGSPRRVYLMAVPKNSAITMAISSGGSIGFDVAGAADINGNAIVLSGGRNITDTGTGNPITGPSLVNQPVTINIARGNYTSGAWVSSNNTVNIADAVVGGTPDIKFAGQLNVAANTVNMNLTQGVNTVGGDLVLDASGDLQRQAGTAGLTLDGASTTLTVGGKVDVRASNGPGVGITSSAAFYTNGGLASITASNGAVLSAAGNILATADALGQTSGASPAQGPSTSGDSTVTASTGGQIISTDSGVVAYSRAYGLTAAGGSSTSPAIDAQGGSAQITSTGTGSLISSRIGLIAEVDAYGGTDSLTGAGGAATGGLAQVLVAGGGRINAGSIIGATANAVGGDATPSAGNGGNATAGTAQLIVNNGAVGGNSILVGAAAAGGISATAGGGSATAGTALVQASGLSGMIDVAAIEVEADAARGGASGGGSPGGSATGGTATLETVGPGAAIGSVMPAALTVTARATVGGPYGAANGGAAGNAIGGTATVSASGSTIAATSLTIDASVSGDATSGLAGLANAGTAKLTVVNSGGAFTDTGAAVFAASTNASATTDATVGTAHAGHVQIDNNGTTLAIAGATSFAVGISGNGPTLPADQSIGTVRVYGGIGAFTALGATADQIETVKIGQTTITGSGDVAFASVGSIAVASGGISSSAPGLNVSLRADSGGAGGGTVTLATGAISLTGQGSNTDIFYNPATFGTPTDYSSGVSAGTVTAYQLVNSLTDLQNINNFLTQNFALNRDIDASTTAGSNGGVGFIPLGTDISGNVLNFANGFSGKFHGLDHTITNLTIDRTGTDNTGLFGYVGGTGVVSHVGLVGGSIFGVGYVGAVVGRAAGTVSQVYSTATVQGVYATGGLIGQLDTGASLSQSFARGPVSGSDMIGGLVGVNNGTIDQSYSAGPTQASGGSIGGLVGYNQTGTITRSYALGDVNGGISVGGLVGNNNGTISESYASGHVNAPTLAGGLIGYNSGTVNNSYWDSFIAGSTGIGGNFGTLTNVSDVTSDPQLAGQVPNYAFGPGAYTNFTGANWLWYNGQTRPIGAWEAPRPSLSSGAADVITSVHQLQLIGNDLQAGYLLAANIDASETASATGVWGSYGFVPLGQAGQIVRPGDGFTGKLAGAGKVISNLTIKDQSGVDAGLFSLNAGQIFDLGLVNASVTGTGNNTGAIAGTNAGLISGSFASGTVAGFINVGGLVGTNAPAGTISQSYATGVLSANTIDFIPAIGGIAGVNSGKIDHTYASTTSSNSNQNAQVGGLVGNNAQFAGLSASYWDTVVSGTANACGVDGGSLCAQLTGLTTAQLHSAASYAGWSVDSTGGQAMTWRIYEGQTAPLLKTFLRPLTVSPLGTATTYDTTVPVVGLNLPNGTDLTHLHGTPVVTGAGSNAGTYTLTYGGGGYSDQTGYDITVGPTAQLVINPAALTLNAVTDTRSYNATAASAGTVGVVGLQGNDSVTGLTQAFDSANAGVRTLAVNSGYTVVDGNNGANYTITANTAAGTITPAPLTLAAVTDSRTYNALTTSAATVSVSGLQGSDTVTGLAQSFDSRNAGARTLAVNGGYTVNDNNGGGNYSISLTTAAGTITPAALALSAASDTRAYTGTTASTATVGVSGLQGSDTVTGATQSFDVAVAGPRNIVVNPGYVVNDGNGGANYSVTLNGATGTITQAPLTITANNRTLTYNGFINPGGLTATYTGLVNGEGPANLGSVVGFTGPGVTARNVGTYAVIPNLPAAQNYTITFVNGTTTINPATLTLAAVTDSRTYNTTTGSVGVVGITGLVGSDSVTGASQSFDSANAGARTLVVNNGFTISDGNGGANYAVTRTTAAGTITPAALTLAAVTDSRSYNATASSTGAVSVTGLLGNDSVTGASQSFDSANAGARTLVVNVGYVVNDGNGGANYSATLNSAAGSIIPATATITYTANPATGTYGNAPGALGGTVASTPLFGSDTLATITTGTATFTTAATAASGIGTYAVTGGGLTSGTGNYALLLAQAPGNATAYTVTPRALTVTGGTLSQIYGNAVPALTYTVGGQGLVNGDQLSGALASTASSTGSTGSYLITQGTLAASANYTLSYNLGSVAITARPITVTGASLARVYGDANPALTYTVGGLGLVNGDQLAGAVSTSAAPTSAVGSYAIAQGSLTASGNYALSYVNGVLAVTPRPLTISADSLARFTTDANPALTYTLGGRGLVNGDTLTGALATSAAAGSPAGPYPITQGSVAASSNYAVTYNPGTLTVAPCTAAAGCAAGTAPQVLQQVTSVVSPPPPPGAQNPQQQQQDEQQEQQERKAAAEAQSSGRPRVITSGIINTGPVTLPPPVNEAVTSSGNTTLYGVQ